MNKTRTIIEYGRILCKDDYDVKEIEESPSRLYLKRNAFDNLKNFVSENNDESIDIEKSFSVHRAKQKDFIRVKNYVGVVETKDGTTIEILPKIYQSPTTNEDLVSNTRGTFLKMLKCLRNSPFIDIDRAHLKTCKFPILEVFISTFLNELKKLIKEGIKRRYVQVEENQPFLKGKMLFTQQISKNLVHPERFFVSYDRFDVNIPQNRLVKSTLIKLSRASKTVRNQNLIRQYTFMFDDIPESDHIRKDIALASSAQSRLFSAYDQLLKWARVFLLDESFTNFKGNHLNKAILFPMERIFEDYVSHHFRRSLTDYDVSTQDSKYYLVEQHRGHSKFRLRPDIVLRKDNISIVIDCKWKLLDASAPAKHYYIKQPDMYQLHAYGKKYQKHDGECRELILIYPLQENFKEPLDFFEYEDGLRLRVVPFDLSTQPDLIVRALFTEGIYENI
jgi:5-methylcytosine-specific restriction enzyme subunit McrC